MSASESKSLQQLQEEYLFLSAELEKLESGALAYEHLRNIDEDDREGLKEHGFELRVKMPDGSIMPIERAIKATKNAHVRCELVCGARNAIEKLLLAHPDDRLLVNETKVWTGDRIYESYPAQIDVVYFDKETKTKKADRWFVPELQKWLRENGQEMQ